MININNLTKSYGTDILFRNVNFTINEGECIGLVGRNGFGKTTLFRMLLGQESYDSGDISIIKGYKIGYLQQHIKFTKNTVLEEAALGLPPDEADEYWRVEKILNGLGFDKNSIDRHPSEFSGGYQVRINLARCLVGNYNMLLLDEPTNYLDIVSIRWLTKFLRGWQGEIMLITHDRSFMDSVATHIVGIHRQGVRKIKGDTGKYYDQILIDEEVYEKTRMNDEKKRKEVELFISRFRAKARLANMVQSRIKTLQKSEKLDKLDEIKNIEFSFRYSEFNAKVLMNIKNIDFSYSENSPKLINNLELIIGKDDRIGVIGKNGKGKTTLLRLIAGELEPVAGSIDTHSMTKIGYFGQTNIDRLNPENTALSEIQQADPDFVPQKARNICGALMFEGDNALKRISVLSGGERSRVMLGKLLVQPVNLLLLDEPNNHLDMESCDSLLEAMIDFKGAVIMVTHNEMFLKTLANKLIIFDRDEITIFSGTYEDFLDRVGWQSDEDDDRFLRNKNKKNKKEVSFDKKEIQRRRNDFFKENSKKIKPLENKIKEFELLIEKTEQEKTDNYTKLAEASGCGDPVIIAECSKLDFELTNRIEKFYEELEKVMSIYEIEKKEFDNKLAEYDDLMKN